MSEPLQISDAEWTVMKVIWNNNSCTANDVVHILSETTAWQPKTIKTLINRLVKKGILGYEIDDNDKKTYHYFSQIPENECIKAESQWFLKKVFNGSLNVMLANFLKETKLTEDEIEELKAILEKKKEE